jgi:hypothetical protein
LQHDSSVSRFITGRFIATANSSQVNSSQDLLIAVRFIVGSIHRRVDSSQSYVTRKLD